ncbi:hypothetical protein ASE08_12870 [Rhizobacter sp. Root16D2]|nr:hypothetical protein ASC88_03885 [Rhizobacter sp. Root29]KQV98552.1 hypothetical protein ASC98_07715 [Rhizobacter sp. Root1238]KRB04804.1 hypothetical protein ASE08_12870 [Rhizobacter sp. Root16D2]
MSVTLFALPCAAQSPASAAEYQIKAAYLYKFLAYIEWPPQAFEREHAPIAIGVLGSEQLAGELAQAVAGREVNGHDVLVRRLHAGDTAAGLHVLFVGRSDSARIAQIAATVKGQPLLIVSESDDAFALGSAINFLVVDDKVRFDVALRPVEQAGLKVSSRLLAVARKVNTP